MAFPQTPLDLHVELYIAGAWVEVTSDVAGNENRVVIAQRPGAERGGTGIYSGTATLTLKNINPLGKYANRNPTGTYFGRLGRNTLLRVRVGADVRAVMEVPEWPPRSDATGVAASIPIAAAGVLRRLAQGRKDTVSPLRRSTGALAAASLVAYWPMEDGAGATHIGAVAGTPMSIAGAVTLATASDLPGSDPLLTAAAGSILFAVIPAFPAGYNALTDQWTVSWVMKIPAAPAADIVLAHWWAYTTVNQWYVKLTSGGNIVIAGYDATFTELFAHAGVAYNGAPFTATLYGQWVLFTARVANTPTPDFAMTVTWSLVDTGGVKSRSATVTHAGTAGAPWAIEHLGSGASLGHLAVGVGAAASDVSVAFGWAGERAAARMQRLCTEAGVILTVVGDPADSAPMGPQARDNLVALLQQCADADGGILFETRDVLGLTYRTRVSLYDQASGLDLDYTAAHLSDQVTPTDDDQFIANDVSVARVGGSSARSVQLTGPLSVAPPPAGVGVYDRGVFTPNVFADGQLQPLADWLRHLGTFDGYHFPGVTVGLHRAVWAANATLTAQAAALGIGDLATLTNLPADKRDVDALTTLLVTGYREILGTYERTIAWNTTPGWAWEVWQLETGGSLLVYTVAAGVSTLRLSTQAGPPWSTTAEPYHIQIDGEAMTVTTMVTDTPAFIAAGTVAHANNASVTPGLPAGMSPDVGQLMIAFAAIRNSGTGTVNLPTGWTDIVNVGNIRVMGRYYLTGDTAPTITFAGGVANADTSARIFGFSGLSMDVDASATQLNGSAQNIAYPALNVRRTNNVMLAFGWKQDDWTSVATLAGFTEMADNATTTGDDQGIVADYRLDTTPADLAAGSFVVTGGASAISRSVVVALRPTQTATVTRAVNGVAKSLAAGKTVKGWRLGVTAL